MVGDRLTSCAARRVVQAAYGVTQFNQDEDPALVFAGIITAFVASCESLGLNPRNMIDMGQRYLRDGNVAREVSALRDFIKYQQNREMPKRQGSATPFTWKDYNDNGKARRIV